MIGMVYQLLYSSGNMEETLRQFEGIQRGISPVETILKQEARRDYYNPQKQIRDVYIHRVICKWAHYYPMTDSKIRRNSRTHPKSKNIRPNISYTVSKIKRSKSGSRWVVGKEVKKRKYSHLFR
jgi:hypothetical protein